MKKKSLTVIRNAQIVGNNCKSYDDKHPENQVSLRPIHNACMATSDLNLRRKIRRLANLSKPEIVRGIAHYMG